MMSSEESEEEIIMIKYLSFSSWWISQCTVNQKVCGSHQIKRQSLVTIVTLKYGVMCSASLQ